MADDTVPSDVTPEDGKPDAVKPTGTVGAPNPKTGSADAARGLGGHSKDASHAPGAPAEYMEKGEATKP